MEVPWNLLSNAESEEEESTLAFPDPTFSCEVMMGLWSETHFNAVAFTWNNSDAAVGGEARGWWWCEDELGLLWWPSISIAAVGAIDFN